jgi:hypothetical protein
LHLNYLNDSSLWCKNTIPHECGHALVGWVLKVPVTGIYLTVSSIEGQEQPRLHAHVHMGDEEESNEEPKDLYPAPNQETVTQMTMYHKLVNVVGAAAGCAGSAFFDCSLAGEDRGDVEVPRGLGFEQELDFFVPVAAEIIRENSYEFKRVVKLVEPRFYSASQTAPLGNHILISKSELQGIIGVPGKSDFILKRWASKQGFI